MGVISRVHNIVQASKIRWFLSQNSNFKFFKPVKPASLPAKIQIMKLDELKQASRPVGLVFQSILVGIEES
jgi:hypothetical protein